MTKRTKIVATIGPASGPPEVIRALVQSGVDVFRVNFSHGDEEQRAAFLRDIREVEREVGRPVAICADLCGPKIRVGIIQQGEIYLEAGREIVVQRTHVEGTAERISTTLAELVDVVRPGERILLADGRLRFEVLQASPPEEFTCRIVVGGTLSSGKGMNLPETDLSISALTEKDRQDTRWIAEHDFDFVALSFVQRAGDVDELRALLDEHGCRAQIIAKIEKPQALDHIDAIIDHADAVMVARGDLGVEMDFPAVPVAQKMIALKCETAGKPCIIATDMLDSMTRSPVPTRAEVSDVANAVFDHADAVMLSGESAIGKYPVLTVQAMQRVVVAAEEFLDQHRDADPVTASEPRTTAALAASVRKIMQMQRIAAIVVFTASGTTARLLSKNRPKCPVVALSLDPAVVRRTCLYYGVIPHLADQPVGVEPLLEQSGHIAKDLGLAAKNDHVIVLAGRALGKPGGTSGLLITQVV